MKHGVSLVSAPSADSERSMIPPPRPRRYVAARAVGSTILIFLWLAFVLVFVTTWWDRYTLWQNVLILLGSLIALSMLNAVMSPFRGWDHGGWERSWEHEQRRAWREERRAWRAAHHAGEHAASDPWGSWEVRGPWAQRRGPRPRMPEGLHQRTTISVVAGLAWALFLVLDAAFLWPGMELSQNLALVVASILVLAAVMAATWVPWGIRYAEANAVWRPWEPDAPRAGAESAEGARAEPASESGDETIEG